MIIEQSQNSSINERETSPFTKKIHILSEKNYNEISSYNKNSFRNDKFKKPYIDIFKNQSNDNDYQSKTLIPYYHKYQNRKYLKTLKTKQNNKLKEIINTKTNFFRKKIDNNIINEINNDFQSDKENTINIPQTSRYDIKTKEKYFSKFFKSQIGLKYYNDFYFNNNSSNKENHVNNTPNNMRTINAHSKRNKSTCINPIWINNFNSPNNDKKKNIRNISSNESLFKLEDQLNYEFEIRLLKKQLKEAKKINDNLRKKLIKIKNEQKRIKEDEEKKKELIIIKVIDICKNINSSEKNIFCSSCEEIYNGFNSSNKNSKESKNDELNCFQVTKLFKNMLLNLMDLKYDYENIILKDEFIVGLKTLLDNENENESKDSENNKKFIINNIKELLKEEIKLKAILNKYKYLSLENKKYYDYLIKLCKKLSIKSLQNLDIFLINSLVEADAEFKQINQIKNIVLENNKSNNIYDTAYIKIDKDKYNNHREINDLYLIKPKTLRNRNNSESKKNIYLSSIKKGKEKDSKRYSYYKDNKNLNKSLIFNNIFRNKAEPINKKIFYTYRYCDSNKKNNNKYLIKENNKKKINLYDFIKQKDYNNYINDYLKDDNLLYAHEECKNIGKNKKEVPLCIKNVGIKSFENVNRKSNKNNNYNNNIKFKKYELGLNNKIIGKIKSNIKDEKNKKIKKSYTHNFLF